MSRCKACGAEIVWIRLTSGKMHPCDAEEVFYKVGAGPDRIVTKEGRVVPGTICTGSTDITDNKTIFRGYSSHFATCPFADDLRKG